MALFVIADLHLSLGCDKPMDIFKGWDGYLEKLRANWTAAVAPEDTVVLPGDISWAMKLEDCIEDFTFIEAMPGQKIILKGNHDYWWNTQSKMTAWLNAHRFATIRFLFNNSYLAEGVAICGTRGWMNDPTEAHDEKMMRREEGRLAASLEHATQHHPGAERLAFLHYPPVAQAGNSDEIVQILLNYKVKSCYYGHLHGASIPWARQGVIEGIRYTLVSADALGFDPLPIPVKNG